MSVPTKHTLPGHRKEVNLLIVRENTECLLIGKETIDEAKTKAVAERVITRAASERVARTAFLQANLQAQDAAEHQRKFSGAPLTLRCVSLRLSVVRACAAVPQRFCCSIKLP